MPRVMLYPQSVTMDTVVYIADRGWGGVILRYDPHTNNFTELQYQYCFFTMTELTHQLVVVGGVWYVHCTSQPTKFLCGLPHRGAGHNHTLPLSTPRMVPSCIHLLPMSGGGRWVGWWWPSYSGDPQHVCQPLSVALCYRTPRELQSNVSRHYRLYVVPTRRYAGQASTQRVPLSLYTKHQATRSSGTPFPTPRWSTLQPSLSMDLCWQWEEAMADKEAQPFTSTTKRRTRGTRWETYLLKDEDCACCLLPSGEFLVAGGQDRNGNWTSRMDAAAVKD